MRDSLTLWQKLESEPIDDGRVGERLIIWALGSYVYAARLSWQPPETGLQGASTIQDAADPHFRQAGARLIAPVSRFGGHTGFERVASSGAAMARRGDAYKSPPGLGAARLR